jgi:putative transposase
MGIEAIYPKKNLSIPNSQHKKYPYLLSGVDICRVNQVWCYVPPKRQHFWGENPT